jgi:hypothetical protein
MKTAISGLLELQLKQILRGSYRPGLQLAEGIAKEDKNNFFIY